MRYERPHELHGGMRFSGELKKLPPSRYTQLTMTITFHTMIDLIFAVILISNVGK